jgi:hypothetical protein
LRVIVAAAALTVTKLQLGRVLGRPLRGLLGRHAARGAQSARGNRVRSKEAQGNLFPHARRSGNGAAMAAWDAASADVHTLATENDTACDGESKELGDTLTQSLALGSALLSFVCCWAVLYTYKSIPALRKSVMRRKRARARTRVSAPSRFDGFALCRFPATLVVWRALADMLFALQAIIFSIYTVGARARRACAVCLDAHSTGTHLASCSARQAFISLYRHRRQLGLQMTQKAR